MRAGSIRKRLNRLSSNSSQPARYSLIEALEDRTLFSSLTSNGYTPPQIITAYGYNQIKFGNTAGTGAGQTIAIVQPNSDPNIQGDLAAFDQQFGIAAPPSFTVVNQTGGSSLPAGDQVTSDDTALAVEWTHALAPGASILLVETNSDTSTPTNYLQGVQYAASAAGVSVVEMNLSVDPYGFGQELISEFPGETSDDSIFTTPAGHGNVTFVAAAGDGDSSSLNYPSSSPNVLSVGGTVLTTASGSSDYGSETAWSEDTDGPSAYETEPTYQSVAQNSGKRDVADVSFNAGNDSLDSGNGLDDYDVYNSYFPFINNWGTLQGTTAGDAAWAALIAIADQGRSASGLPTLDGPTDTLPDLYDLYAAPNTGGYSTYQTYFHDVTTGGATAGYDPATGLGSPIAPTLAKYLSEVPSHNGGGGGNGGGGSGSGGSTGSGSGGLTGLSGLGHLPITQNGGTGNNGGGQSSGGQNNSPPPEVLPPILPAVELSGQFLSAPPAQLTIGKSVSLSLQLTNTGSLAFSGPIKLVLSAVNADSVSAPLKTVRVGKLKIKANGTKVVKFHFKLPASVNTGTYSLEATGIAVKDNLTVLQPLLAGTVSID